MLNRSPRLLQLSLGVLLCLSNAGFAYEDKAGCDSQANELYTFAWPISDDCSHKPRGGTSTGADVELANAPRKEWLSLRQPGIAKFERDRRAILGMQGGYKVNFDFLETVGFSDDYKRDRPYQSWGTEYVYVIENKPNFISLQHVMVMYFKQKDGSVSEPMVMKHWRQDWTYEDRILLEYSHDNRWNKVKLARKDVAGKWSQAVFQVDDSPRYESYGQWQHNASFSTWISHTTRRPLPRREYSVRDDYSVLEGFNRHTVTQYGWVQEEENWKLLLNDSGDPAAKPYVAKEEGLARYREVSNVDFSAGDSYMKKTAPVWALVRHTWVELVNDNATIKLKKTVDGQPMFMPLFTLAQNFADDEVSLSEAAIEVEKIVSRYLD